LSRFLLRLLLLDEKNYILAPHAQRLLVLTSGRMDSAA
jgi:hypothetical protein